MADLNYPITPQVLPSGFCGSTWQEILNQFAANLFVSIPITNSQLVVSATKPADTTVAWYQLDSLGRPTYLFYFAQGAWLSRHPAVTGLTQWWFNSLPDFTTFDGGDANPISPVSGAMWQQAVNTDGTVIAAQFPIAAGTLPSGKVLSVGDVGGEELHVLTPAETAVPSHKHLNSMFVGPNGVEWNHDAGSEPASSSSIPSQQDTSTARVQPYTGDGVPMDPAQTVQGHNTIPPYVTGYVLQRTARLFYRVD